MKKAVVRIDKETLRWARIAAAYRGVTLEQWLSETLMRVARDDASGGSGPELQLPGDEDG